MSEPGAGDERAVLRPVPPGGRILSREQAQELAARSARLRRRLTLEDVERELPLLDTPEHIRAALELLQRWGTGGLLPGTVLNGGVRAAEVALKLYEVALDRDRIAALEKQIKALQDELRQRGRAP